MKQIMEDINCRTYEELKIKAERISEWRIAAQQYRLSKKKYKCNEFQNERI